MIVKRIQNKCGFKMSLPLLYLILMLSFLGLGLLSDYFDILILHFNGFIGFDVPATYLATLAINIPGYSVATLIKPHGVIPWYFFTVLSLWVYFLLGLGIDFVLKIIKSKYMGRNN